MKTIKCVLVLIAICATTLLIAQDRFHTRWAIDRTTKVTSKITKELKLSKEDSVKYFNAFVEKCSNEIEYSKGLNTLEEKREPYMKAYREFISKLKSTFPESQFNKLNKWYNENYQNFKNL